jgi:hypothetical protein
MSKDGEHRQWVIAEIEVSVALRSRAKPVFTIYVWLSVAALILWPVSSADAVS